MSRYENYSIKNNIFGTLAVGISSLSTSIQLTPGQGARFSVNMLATLEHTENNKVTKREIVLITAVNGDVLTVTRKYEACPPNDDSDASGKASFSFDGDDTISAYITKGHFDNISESINDLMNNGNDRLRVKSTGGLNISVTPGNVRVGTSEFYFAGGTATLVDNSTNYVELTGAGTIDVSTIGRDVQFAKLAKITTSNGQISSIEHWKIDTVGGVMNASAGFKNINNCIYNGQGELTQFVADGVQYNLTYEYGVLKTISFGETLYTISYENGRLVSVVES